MGARSARSQLGAFGGRTRGEALGRVLTRARARSGCAAQRCASAATQSRAAVGRRLDAHALRQRVRGSARQAQLERARRKRQRRRGGRARRCFERGLTREHAATSRLSEPYARPRAPCRPRAATLGRAAAAAWPFGRARPGCSTALPAARARTHARTHPSPPSPPPPPLAVDAPAPIAPPARRAPLAPWPRLSQRACAAQQMLPEAHGRL